MTSPATPFPVSAPRSREVPSGGVTLAVREWGSVTDPTVVLVHGYPDTQELWTDVAVRLARKHHVVTFDLRGFGSSTPPPEGTAGYALPRLLDDLDSVLTVVAPGRRVHLAGHDWGAIVGWEAAAATRFAGQIVSYTAVACPGLGTCAPGRPSTPASHPAALGRTRGRGDAVLVRVRAARAGPARAVLAPRPRAGLGSAAGRDEPRADRRPGRRPRRGPLPREPGAAQRADRRPRCRSPSRWTCRRATRSCPPGSTTTSAGGSPT